MSKNDKTMVVVRTEIKDKAKEAAAVNGQKLQAFVERALVKASDAVFRKAQ